MKDYYHISPSTYTNLSSKDRPVGRSKNNIQTTYHIFPRVACKTPTSIGLVGALRFSFGNPCWSCIESPQSAFALSDREYVIRYPVKLVTSGY